MKAEIGELVKSFGEIRFMPENVDDLWHLHHLITPGSLVFATTLRSVEGSQDKIRPEKMEKRPVRLGIRVEATEFHDYSIRLRVFGIIESGVDISSHHTLNLEPGFDLSVIKKWSGTDLERIERAKKCSGSESLHILMIEEGEASLYRIFSYGPKQIWSLNSGSGKTGELNNREEFSKEVIKEALSISDPIIIAGPGFVKDEIASAYKRQITPGSNSPIIIDTRSGGLRGVQEVIGQGTLEKITGDIQLAREVSYLDELMRRIGKDEPVAYGIDDVSNAIACGAVSTLMISDSLLKNNNITDIIRQAEDLRSEIVILSTRFEPGERLEGLGGVAALLRFPIS